MAALHQITFKKPATRAAPSSPSAQFDGPGIMVIAGGAQTGSHGFGRQLSGLSPRAAPPVSQPGACICCLSLLREAAVPSTQAVQVAPAHLGCLNWQPRLACQPSLARALRQHRQAARLVPVLACATLCSQTVAGR